LKNLISTRIQLLIYRCDFVEHFGQLRYSIVYSWVYGSDMIMKLNLFNIGFYYMTTNNHTSYL
jgi:hypothetical protein